MTGANCPDANLSLRHYSEYGDREIYHDLPRLKDNCRRKKRQKYPSRSIRHRCRTERFFIHAFHHLFHPHNHRLTFHFLFLQLFSMLLSLFSSKDVLFLYYPSTLLPASSQQVSGSLLMLYVSGDRKTKPSNFSDRFKSARVHFNSAILPVIGRWKISWKF